MVSLEESEDPELESLAARLLRAGMLVDELYTPILCIFGFLGNSLSLAVFCLDSNYRRQSASYYLSALAVSDTGFLLSLFAVWWESRYGGVITSKIMCPLVMYLGQVACFISVYLIVAFSLERYVAIHYPLSRATICTISKAKKKILGIVSLALLIFSYAWIIAQVIEIKPLHLASESTENGTNFTHVYSNENEITNNSRYFLNETDIDQENVNEVPHNFPFGTKSRQTHVQSIQQTKTEYDYRFLENNSDVSSIWSNETDLDAMNIYKIHVDRSENQPDSLEIQINQLLVKHESTLLGKYDDTADYDTAEPASEIHDSDDGSFQYCSVPEQYYFISEIANYLDMAITLAFPFFLITFVNVRIAVFMWKLRDERAHILASTALATSTSGKKETKREKQFSGTKRPSSALLLPNQHVESNKSSRSNSNSTGSISFENGNQMNEVVKTEQSKKEPSETDKSVNRMEVKVGESTLHNTARSIEKTGLTPVSATAHQQKRLSNTTELRVTKLLLLVSTVFLVLNLPLHVIRCAQFMQSITGTKETQDIFLFLQPWANILFNTNFAVNFFLYCASGSHFRNTLKKLTVKLLGLQQKPKYPIGNSTQKQQNCRDKVNVIK